MRGALVPAPERHLCDAAPALGAEGAEEEVQVARVVEVQVVVGVEDVVGFGVGEVAGEEDGEGVPVGCGDGGGFEVDG